MTPFGRPVEPEVKRNLAIGVGGGRGRGLVDAGAGGRAGEIVEQCRAKVRAVAARNDFRSRAERRDRLGEWCGVGDIDEARLEQIGDVPELGEVLALQRVGDRDRRDRNARRVACQHQQRVIDRVGREDHDRPLGREPARHERCRDGVDAAARVLVGDLDASVSRTRSCRKTRAGCASTAARNSRARLGS